MDFEFKIGLIYSPNSASLRRIVIPSSPTTLSDPTIVGDGEAILVVHSSAITTVEEAMVAVEKTVGRSRPSTSRCAIVDSGDNVVGFVTADPEVDTPPPGLRLLRTATAIPGARYRSSLDDFLNPEEVLSTRYRPPADPTAPTSRGVST